MNKSLNAAYENALKIPYNIYERYVIMSDCHRGVANWGDNFLNNQNIFFAALNYYYKNSFTYIEAGDGEELWENRSMKSIIQAHSDVYWLMSKFYEKNRLFMIAGNHDLKKKRWNYCKETLNEYHCESTNCKQPLFPGILIREGIILEGERPIFIVHGHQGEFINDIAWTLGKLLARYVWKPLELIGVTDPTGAGRNYEKNNAVDNKLITFAKENNCTVIAGHTHRPVFSKEHYFNAGSCVHPRCITALEIINGNISLVKWHVKAKDNQDLYIAREVLEGPSSDI